MSLIESLFGKLSSFLEALSQRFYYLDATSWILLGGFFLLCILSRKTFGGFFKAFLALLGLLMFLVLLYAIHPILMWGFLIMGVVAILAGNYWRQIKKMILLLAVGFAIFMAIKNNFF